jgi:CDGSH-type Zn-finger protein
MEEPNIKAKAPAMVELEANKQYAWCACGHSKNESGLCDGSHKVTSFKPIMFSVEENKKAAICMCKHSGKKPFCDGTHKTL